LCQKIKILADPRYYREVKIGLISGAGVYGSLLRQGDNDLIIWKAPMGKTAMNQKRKDII
jgi:hypothetical protein